MLVGDASGRIRVMTKDMRSNASQTTLTSGSSSRITMHLDGRLHLYLELSRSPESCVNARFYLVRNPNKNVFVFILNLALIQ